MSKEYYNEKRISNSSLSWFQKSPMYFKLMLEGLIKEPSKPWFEWGEELHMYVLEPEVFEKEYSFMDYSQPKSQQQKEFCEKYANTKKGKDGEKLLNAYKFAYSTKENDEKILEKAKKLKKEFKSYIDYIKQKHLFTKILPNSKLYKLNESKTALMDHRIARELLFNEEHSVFGNSDKLFIQNEFQINWEWSKENYAKLPCKSLIDRLIIDHEHKTIKLIDLKTTYDLSEFPSKFREYKYNRQLAFYWMAIYWYFKNKLQLNADEYEKETYIVAISSSEPIEVKVFKIMEMSINDGLHEIEDLMHKLEWHWIEDKWDYNRLYYEGSGIELI